MSNFTIRSGSYCPVCKGMALRDCSHSMEQLRQAVSGIAPASRTELDRLTLVLGALGLENTELRRDLAEARRDAERYRHCRNTQVASWMGLDPWAPDVLEQLDAAIDAAVTADSGRAQRFAKLGAVV